MEDADILSSLVKTRNKFVIGGDESTALPSSPPPAEITSNTANTSRRSHRHHVKRRSVGHAKMRPLPRVRGTSLTDTEADTDDGAKKRAPLRRSQSHRSLRVDNLTMTGSTPSTQSKGGASASGASGSGGSSSSSNPSSLHVSQGVVAQPIAQTFHAVANNLVVPESRAAYSAVQIIRSSPQPSESALLPSPSPGRRRRRLQSQFDDADREAPKDPAELLEREYRCIRQHQDPMVESLVRCMLRKRRINVSRTMSSSAVHSIAPPPMHTAQRLAARRHRLSPLHPSPAATAATSSASSAASSSTSLLGLRNTASSLWERMMRGY